MSSYGPMKRGAKHMTSSSSRPSPMGQPGHRGASVASKVARASNEPTAAAAAQPNNFNPFAANKINKKSNGGEARTRAGQGFVFSKKHTPIHAYATSVNE